MRGWNLHKCEQVWRGHEIKGAEGKLRPKANLDYDKYLTNVPLSNRLYVTVTGPRAAPPRPHRQSTTFFEGGTGGREDDFKAGQIGRGVTVDGPAGCAPTPPQAVHDLQG